MAISAADLTVNFSTKGAEKVTGDIGKVNKGITSFASGVAKVAGGFVLGTVLAGVTRAFAGTIGGALDFERQMANVNSILQISQDELGTYTDAVLAMAGRTAQAPQVLAAGLYDVASSGFAGQEGLVVLEAAANAATAGLTTTDVAARAITAGLNAYGLEADQAGRVSDVLFQTVNEGVITFDQLAKNLGNTLPIAASLGVSIEELGAAYAQMTLSGVGASQAETQIAALMRSALNPTDQLTAAVQAQGHASAAAAIESEGLAGFLKIVTEAAGDDKEALFDLLGTQEAMNAATILGKNGVDDYLASLERMNLASEDGGATQKALAKQMQSSAFQIQRAKVAVQTLAIVGFGILAPLVAKAAMGLTSFINRGLIPFGRVIASAFKGGFAFNELIGDLPQPLQRAAHAVGVIAEAVGDLIRGGFSANEFRQAWSGIQALGDELAQGARFIANIAIDLVTNFAGWLWDNRGAIWEGIKSLVGWSFDTIQEAIGIEIDGGVTVTGGLAEIGGDLWAWIRRTVMGLPSEGDLTGGPDPFGANQISVGTVLITGAGKLGEGIAEIAADLSAWLTEQIAGKSDSYPVDVANVVINVLDATADITAADVEAWIQKDIDTLGAIEAELKEWGIILGGDPDVTGAEEAKPGLESDLKALLGPLDFLVDAYVGLDNAIPDITPDTIAGVNDALQRLLSGEVKVSLDDWGIDLRGVPVIGSLGRAIEESTVADWIYDNIFTDTIKVPLTDWSISLPTTPEIVDFVGNLGIVTAIRDKIGSITANLTDLTEFILAMPDITVPSASEIGDAILGKIPDGIKVNITDLVEFILGAPAGEEGAPGWWREGQPGGPNALMAGGGPRAMTTSRGGLAGAMAAAGGFRLPAPDTSVFDKAISGALDNVRKLTAETFTAKLTADPSQFVSVIAASTTAGMAFAGLTFTPDLNADPSLFVRIVAAATSAGVAFAGMTFTATISANANQALQAIFAATNAANNFARTYTATLTVNTGGAIAAAQNAAQTIRDLLPSSPAKTGPLRFVPDFSFVGDAALREADRIVRAFDVPFGRGARGIGSRPALAGGPRTVNITISGVRDEDAVMRRLARELDKRGL